MSGTQQVLTKEHFHDYFQVIAALRVHPEVHAFFDKM